MSFQARAAAGLAAGSGACGVSAWLNEEQARARLVKLIAKTGSQKAVADLAGVSESLVSAAMCGQKPIGKRIGAVLGLVAVTVRTYQYLPREEHPDA